MMLFGNSDPMTVQTWLFLLSILLLPNGFVVLLYLFIGSLTRDTVKRPRNEADIFNTFLAIAFVLYFPLVAVSVVASTTSLVIFLVVVPTTVSTLLTFAQWNLLRVTQVVGFVAVITILLSATLWISIPDTSVNPLVKVLVVPAVWLIGYSVGMIFAVKDYSKRAINTPPTQCPVCQYQLIGIPGSICPECGNEFSQPSPTA